jgi:hypothetical protein
VLCSLHFLFCAILILALANPTRFYVQQVHPSREFFLTSFLLALRCSHVVTCMKHLRAHPHECARTNQLTLCTRGYSANRHAADGRGSARCHGASRNASVAPTSQVCASVVVIVYRLWEMKYVRGCCSLPWRNLRTNFVMRNITRTNRCQ